MNIVPPTRGDQIHQYHPSIDQRNAHDLPDGIVHQPGRQDSYAHDAQKAEHTCNALHVLLISTVLVGGLVYAGGVWIAMAERVGRVIAFVKSMGTPAREREAGEDRAEPGNARRTER